jgi:hypothetical protein
LPAYAAEKPELSTLFAHQHLLEVSAERGRPYVLLWAAGLVALLKPASGPKRFGPVAALVHGLVDYPLSVPGVFWLFCVSTALAAPESSRSVNVPLRWRPLLCAAVLAAALAAGAAVRRNWQADRLRAQGIVAISGGYLDEGEARLASSEDLSPHPEAARLRAELVLRLGGSMAEAAGHLERAIALDPYRASNRELLKTLPGSRER